MSHPIFGETLQSNGCRVFYTNQTITIMTDRIHGYYTLDTLRMLNPLYDYEHRMTEQDVDAVNALRAHIESTRSFATVGDRIAYTDRYGNFYKDALLASREVDGGDRVCLVPFVPFTRAVRDGVQCHAGGGPWVTLVGGEIFGTGPRMGEFQIWGHDGPCGNGAIRFEAEVQGWRYNEPDPLYGDFTTAAWRKLLIYRIRQPNGKDLYGGQGWELGGETDFQAFVRDYKATVFEGHSLRQLVVWCYHHRERPLTPEAWDALDAPIVKHCIYNAPQPVKVLYDDERHERICCYVPPKTYFR